MNDEAEVTKVDTKPRARALATVTPTMDTMMAQAVAAGDVAMLERLWALRQQVEKADAQKAFVVAMTGFKSEPIEIFKRKHVKFLDVDYMHAELSDITDAISPAMAKHGLSFRWNTWQVDGTIHVACILTHIAGHSEEVALFGSPDKSGKKNDIQAVGSTVQYLQRYTLLAITGMSTKGMDNDGRGGEEGPTLEDEGMLMAARVAAMEGEAELREWFDATCPPDDGSKARAAFDAFWLRESKSLKIAAHKADKDAKA